jgi:hypothetical protein
MKTTFILILLFVALHAIGDATRDDKKKLSHFVRSLFILCGLSMAAFFPGDGWKDFLVLLIWYAANRLFLFDLIYNAVRGLRLDYIGSTSFWDVLTLKILIRIKMPNHFWLFIKFVLWIVVNGWILYNYKF